MKRVLARFDTKITQFIQAWLQRLGLPMLFFTLLGQPIFTITIPLLIAAYGFYQIISLNEKAEPLIIAGSIAIITFGICTLLKAFLKRERPDTKYVDSMYFDTFSFPSGHATGAVASYGLVTYLILPALMQPWGLVAIIALAVLSLMIGISRIYLGAHYPSDVLGGWLLGAGGLYIIIHYIQPTI